MAEAGKKRRKFLTLADIEKVEDRPITEVEIPEWGGWFRIRPLTAEAWEDAQNQARIEGTADLDELVVKPVVIAAGVVDHAGNPVFSVDEARKLMKKAVGPVNRLSSALVISTLASLSGEITDEAEEVEAAEATFLAGEPGSSEPG